MKRPPPLPRKKDRSRFGFGNALLGWELLRVSRRTGALAIGRFAFGAALLGVMWVLWSSRYSQYDIVTGDVSAIGKILNRFAGEFSLTFFLIQVTLVLLLTPIFVCGSVFEERDTRSGEVLLTTDLTRREIFYGKLLARLVQVGMVVAAGMPILSLTLLWGGVAIHFIAVGYMVTFFCILSSGAIAASVSGSSETFRQAVLKSYAWILVFDAVIFPASPYFLIVTAREEITSSLCCGMFFIPIQLVVIFVSLAHGLRWLRLAMLRQRKRVTAELALQMAKRKPPVPEEDPLFWKERFVAGNVEMSHMLIVCLSLTTLTVVGVLAIFGALIFPPGWVTVYVTPTILASAIAVVGLATAGGVARERQKNTLIDLFMIPGGRREILRAKLYGALWNARWLLLTVPALLLLGIVSGTPVVAIPLLAASSVAFLAFGAMLGLWLSVRCRSALTANSIWISAISLSLIGTFLLADALSHRDANSFGGTRIVYPEWSRAMNPIMGWQSLAMTPEEKPVYVGKQEKYLRLVPDQWPRLLNPLAGVALYGALAWLCWVLALRTFEKEGRE